MAENEFGPLRSKSGRKPWPECPDIVIYRCPSCGALLQNLGYALPPEEPFCCGARMERLPELEADDLPPGLSVDYKIVGGFNNSAVQVFWTGESPEDRPAWIMLRTFTGSYIKYLTGKKRPPLVFPLSDEDAYVYCDREECERCVFRCKKGFIIHVYFARHGLVALPMDKISEYFKTNPGKR